jgi:hypothetical protein
VGLLSTLLGAYGQHAQAKRQSTLDEDARTDAAARRTYEQQQLDEQKRYDDANIARQKAADALAARNSGLDPNTLQPIPLAPLPASVTQILPHNRGFGDVAGSKTGEVSPETTTAHYRDVASQYMQQYARTGNINAKNAADFYQKMADQTALQTSRFGSAALSTARVGTEAAHAEYYRAAAVAARDLPARARAIAAGHDKAAWDRATAQINSHQLIAQYSGQTRMWVAQLAGAYMVAGRKEDEAARMAVAELNDKTRIYLQRTNPRSTLLDPNAAAGAQDPTLAPLTVPGSTTTNNYYGTGGAPGFPGAQPPLDTGAKPGSNVRPLVVPPKPPVPKAGKLTVPAAVAIGRAQLAAGSKPAQIHQYLQEAVSAGALSPADAQEVERQLDMQPGGLFSQGVSLAPPPIQRAGGSQAAVPFPVA